MNAWIELDRSAAVFRCRSLSIEGVYTHLCAADADSPRDIAFTLAQSADHRTHLHGSGDR